MTTTQLPRKPTGSPPHTILLAIVVTSFGGYRVAEAGALSHNHLCHAHNSDSCGLDHDKDHTHWFGGRAARPE